jgi:hypothetical protein
MDHDQGKIINKVAFGYFERPKNGVNQCSLAITFY